MLIDARTVPRNKSIETDVCIIGAGAAGITLARDFSSRSFQVSLLESGGLEFDEDTQPLYAGDVVGLPYVPLDAARLRYFGGTTNHWSGWCQPLDEIDFESRDWIPHSGWPFSKFHLVPFYERAQSIVQIGPFAYNIEAWEVKGAVHLPFVGDRVMSKMVQFSPPTRFGQVYRSEIAQAKNIRAYLHANVTEIETTRDARRVTGLRVACLQGNEFRVSAKIFILAAGGIENARLLLLSNKVQNSGLGNQNDLVGRFFMDHGGIRSGIVLLSDPNSAGLYRLHTSRKREGKNGQKVIAELILTPGTTRREKLANCCTVLEETSWLRVLRDEDFVSAVDDLIKNVGDIATTAYWKFFKGAARRNLFRLYNIVEPVPNPDSRVNLSTDRDMLGQNRVKLDLRLTAADKRTFVRAQEIIAAELGRAGLGRLKLDGSGEGDNWLSSVDYGRHHMGTTRMHIDPKKGVVDSNCKVHGVSNLFIAGSSVFPTYGYAQPTLTIVALALRLADHVKTLLKQ